MSILPVTSRREPGKALMQFPTRGVWPCSHRPSLTPAVSFRVTSGGSSGNKNACSSLSLSQATAVGMRGKDRTQGQLARVAGHYRNAHKPCGAEHGSDWPPEFVSAAAITRLQRTAYHRTARSTPHAPGSCSSAHSSAHSPARTLSHPDLRVL